MKFSLGELLPKGVDIPILLREDTELVKINGCLPGPTKCSLVCSPTHLDNCPA